MIYGVPKAPTPATISETMQDILNLLITSRASVGSPHATTDSHEIGRQSFVERSPDKNLNFLWHT
ncbi:glycoside hydrolase family 16 protein [Sesbania bispinosa]|nr:glycoside hydrolase family 16 protein [Sesbania bispinosa]